MIERGPGTEYAGLSRAGEQRREEILAGLQKAMTSRRRRRRTFRALGAGAAAGAVGLAAILIWNTGPAGGRKGSDRVAEGPRVQEHTAAFTLVRDDPGIVDRVAVRGGMTKTIDDDELASLLAEAGRPNGFVRTGGRVYLESDLAHPEEDAAPGT